MALARCKTCGVRRNAQNYVAAVRPVGHPRSGLVCGITRCEREALIWLTAPDLREFKAGIRVFGLPSSAAKVRAEDELVEI